MRPPRVTSIDVARLAGVSRATVSLILNNSDRVTLSQETRRRVLEAAEQLGYRPNTAARMLVSGVTETIGLVVTDPALLLHDGFVAQVLYGIEQANRDTGFHVLLEGMRVGSGPEGYDDLVQSRRIDGLIVLNPRSHDAALAGLIARGYPLVLMGSIGHPDEVSVSAPAMAAIAAAVDHLVALGHRRIGTVTFAPRHFTGSANRVAAIRRCLDRHGLRLDDDAVVDGDFTAESGYQGGRALLARRPDLSAILAGNDTLAIGVLAAAHDLGRRVPDDLSLVGYDDLPFAARLVPPLTTIRSDGVRQGVVAAEMLIARLGRADPTHRHADVPATFIPRRSTGPARTGA